MKIVTVKCFAHARVTEELRQRNIEVGLISERPPSCMSDNDGDSRAGWMKEVLVDSLGDHDEPTILLAFDQLRGGSKALYIKDCTADDVTCHLLSPNSDGLFFDKAFGSRYGRRNLCRNSMHTKLLCNDLEWVILKIYFFYL